MLKTSSTTISTTPANNNLTATGNTATPEVIPVSHPPALSRAHSLSSLPQLSLASFHTHHHHHRHQQHHLSGGRKPRSVSPTSSCPSKNSSDHNTLLSIQIEPNHAVGDNLGMFPMSGESGKSAKSERGWGDDEMWEDRRSRKRREKSERSSNSKLVVMARRNSFDEDDHSNTNTRRGSTGSASSSSHNNTNNKQHNNSCQTIVRRHSTEISPSFFSRRRSHLTTNEDGGSLIFELDEKRVLRAARRQKQSTNEMYLLATGGSNNLVRNGHSSNSNGVGSRRNSLTEDASFESPDESYTMSMSSESSHKESDSRRSSLTRYDFGGGIESRRSSFSENMINRRNSEHNQSYAMLMVLSGAAALTDRADLEELPPNPNNLHHPRPEAESVNNIANGWIAGFPTKIRMQELGESVLGTVLSSTLSSSTTAASPISPIASFSPLITENDKLKKMETENAHLLKLVQTLTRENEEMKRSMQGLNQENLDVKSDLRQALTSIDAVYALVSQITLERDALVARLDKRNPALSYQQLSDLAKSGFILTRTDSSTAEGGGAAERKRGDSSGSDSTMPTKMREAEDEVENDEEGAAESGVMTSSISTPSVGDFQSGSISGLSENRQPQQQQPSSLQQHFSPASGEYETTREELAAEVLKLQFELAEAKAELHLMKQSRGNSSPMLGKSICMVSTNSPPKGWSKIAECRSCGGSFGVSRWRHQCHMCRQAYCADCTETKRVCKSCVAAGPHPHPPSSGNNLRASLPLPPHTRYSGGDSSSSSIGVPPSHRAHSLELTPRSK